MQPPLAPVKPGPSPDIAAGTTLYGQSFCASCHAMQNAAGMMVGGNVGPELTGIGTKAKAEWLQDWVSNPDHYDPTTLMPRYRFDAKQIAVLLGFLESKTEPDFVANVHLDPATQGIATRAASGIIAPTPRIERSPVASFNHLVGAGNHGCGGSQCQGTALFWN